MQWSKGYEGWDDRRLPVKLEPTWWASWGRRGILVLSLLVLGTVFVAVWADVAIRSVWIMPIFLLVLIAAGQIGQRERFDRLVPTRLTLGLCPQCFYRLDNLDREEDNATVCPECGAAWVLPGKAKKG